MPHRPAGEEDPVADLIRAAMRAVLDDRAAVVASIHDAVANYAPEAVRDDPALVAEIERSNLAVLTHFLSSMERDPRGEVEPLLTPETIDFTSAVMRRGIRDVTTAYFHAGLERASQSVMNSVFVLSPPADVMREAFEVMLAAGQRYSARSVAAIRAAADAERGRRSASATRLDTVVAVLAGEGIDEPGTSLRLGFRIDQPLVGCIAWTAPGTAAAEGMLTRAVSGIAEALGTRPPLVVPASAASVWAWLPIAEPVDSGRVLSALGDTTARVAFGGPGEGIDGFRITHRQAAEAQRVMHRAGAWPTVATHGETRVAAFAGNDERAVAAFLAAVLGDLAGAAPELRATLLAHINLGFDTKRTAATLDLHRNTVLARTQKARSLLPAGDDPPWMQIALALDLARWWPAALEAAAEPRRDAS